MVNVELEEPMALGSNPKMGCPLGSPRGHQKAKPRANHSTQVLDVKVINQRHLSLCPGQIKVNLPRT